MCRSGFHCDGFSLLKIVRDSFIEMNQKLHIHFFNTGAVGIVRIHLNWPEKSFDKIPIIQTLEIHPEQWTGNRVS